MSRRRCNEIASRANACRLCLVLLAFSLLSLGVAAPAMAGAWWRLASRAAPTYLAPGGQATIIISATDVGDSAVNATSARVTIKDTLPTGLEATEIKGAPAFELLEEGHEMSCDLAALSCASQAETLSPFQALDVTIQVKVKSGAKTGEENTATVVGGEQEGGSTPAVAEASAEVPITVNGQLTPFGVEADGYALTSEEEGGAPDERAGSHPFQLTTTLDLNQASESVAEQGLVPAAPALPRELDFDLPPGLIGDPQAVPACPTADFLAIGTGFSNACKAPTAIGVAVVTLDEPAHFHYVTRAVPLWNLEPALGEPARFGFEVLKVPIVLDTSVRTSGDYGVTVKVENAPESAQILGSEVTIWGVPGDARHAQSRGWACILGGVYFNNEVPCESHAEPEPHAFLTLPTSCTGPLKTTLTGQSWPVKALASEPGQVFSLEGGATEYGFSSGLQGCELLPFDPSIDVQPEQQEQQGHAQQATSQASTPTGLRVAVKVPQETTLQPNGLAEADVQTTTVTLPEGVLLNPSAANGLQACSEQQIGFEGPAGEDPLSAGAPQALKFSNEPANCPDASKVGAVRIKTPLLADELIGAVYLAAPAPSGEAGKNPFNSLVALYVVAEDPASGIRVKLAGEAELDEQTGQIMTSFQNTPQVPFDELTLQLFGGPRASISTPAACGGYSTRASFTPWSGAGADSVLSGGEEFAISSGPGGGACPAGSLPFAPSFVAGSTSLQAGGFSPFSLTIANLDGDQGLGGLSVQLPPGVAALLSSVMPCAEPPAGQEWACGPESLIGHSTAQSGLGSDPYTLPGSVYLTVGDDHAPFGILVVTPAVAGPFNLGDVDVRSRITVNPETAAVTISSEPFPQFVKGVPVQLKQINVSVDRPGFQFNPTSCKRMAITGTLTGAQGAGANVSSPFQVAGCQSLPFAPRLTASAGGHASKADGTNLDVKVTSAGLGQANIARLALQLPKALSSRLSTLQKACPEALFNANPASCDVGSVIGHAIVHTPVLRGPLMGPAYLVSHGGAAFPDLEFVLQGEGITIVVDAKTDIKAGITYSRLETVPDAPFTSFETELPAGPDSVLTANVPEKDDYSLCGKHLEMPTVITAQNGVVINQNTPITTAGCSGVLSTKTKLTKAQLLAKALKACRKRYNHSKAKRQACERQSRNRYAAKASKKHARKKK